MRRSCCGWCDHGFGRYSWLFPVGIDAGIVAMYGLDLVLVWRRMPKPLLRLIAHGLTAATIVFNAAAGEKPVLQDPLGALMHGVLPVLFVAVVESVRHLIIRTNRLVLGVESDTVPLHRWILSPWAAFKTYRRMKLRGITSYAQVVQMDKELDVYAAYLQHTHGRSWKKKAGATAMLPFTMAAYGLTADEALDQPRLQQEAADRRAAAEADRIAAARPAEEARLLDQDERKADNAIRRTAIDTKVTAAQHDTTTAKATAAAEAKAAAAAGTAEHTAALTAEAERRAAERAAEAAEAAAQREAETLKTAAEREAEARAAAALRAAETDRRAAAEAAAEAGRKKAEAERLEAEPLESLARQEEAVRAAEQAKADAAILRELAARTEAAALEAEDTARLSPRERAERKVARLILAAHHALPADQRPETPDMYAVSLETVQDALGVSHTVAPVVRLRRPRPVKSLPRGLFPAPAPPRGGGPAAGHPAGTLAPCVQRRGLRRLQACRAHPSGDAGTTTSPGEASAFSRNLAASGKHRGGTSPGRFRWRRRRADTPRGLFDLGISSDTRAGREKKAFSRPCPRRPPRHHPTPTGAVAPVPTGIPAHSFTRLVHPLPPTATPRPLPSPNNRTAGGCAECLRGGVRGCGCGR
ncbi:DUF2637 domain-containing protein [Streptomyces filamentosus]|uniref:DUF2637 domain-containing protein n=1 Tax=Streptomyces filamentosus TaxID=67294 RepID=UPI0012390721|nr:DUF2637 domain-containing protein [Streptomyces filamentosus]